MAECQAERRPVKLNAPARFENDNNSDIIYIAGDTDINCGKF